MKLYKGSVFPITVAFAPCYCKDGSLVEDLSLTFFTTPGTGITFSGDSITVSGMSATVTFQPVQTEALEDGVLRFISEFTYSGEPATFACATDKYLLTPPAYTPIDFVTSENVQEVVSEAVGVELNNRTYVINQMSTEEKVALYNELIQYTDNRGCVKGTFPVWKYQFYGFQSGPGIYTNNASTGFHNLSFRGYTMISDEKTLVFNGVPIVTYESWVVYMQMLLTPEGLATLLYIGAHVVRALNGQYGALELKTINGNDIIGSGDIEITATLPVASSDTLGGVKIGEGISIDENGVISVSDNV